MATNRIDIPGITVILSSVFLMMTKKKDNTKGSSSRPGSAFATVGLCNLSLSVTVRSLRRTDYLSLRIAVDEGAIASIGLER